MPMGMYAMLRIIKINFKKNIYIQVQLEYYLYISLFINNNYTD